MNPARPTPLLSILLAVGLLASTPMAAATLGNPRVEYRDHPLGIDVETPHFSWQMHATPGARAEEQSAYRITVTDPGGATVWDSDRVADSRSLGIAYEGVPLKPATRYAWTVTAWDQNDEPLTAGSWFETGLMNPTIEGWDGATWIGGGPDDLVLYSDYLSLFRLRYSVAIRPGSSRAGFILAANDPRLMDKNKTVFQLENGRDESYFKLELDVSGLDGSGTGRAKFHVYRAGYTPQDDPSRPVASFDISPQAINDANRYDAHAVTVRAEYGQLGITVDGFYLGGPRTEPEGLRPWAPFPSASVSLNPLGKGHDFITLGMLADIGFAVGPGQQAAFSDVEVTHLHSPRSVIFREDLTSPGYRGIFRSFAERPGSGLHIEKGVYRVAGGSQGAIFTANPSRNAMPLLRTEFQTSGRRPVSGRLYITARGIYEAYLNGRRIGSDHYNPGLTQYNKTQLYQTYDVTPLLTAGSNALGVMLGEGWWSGLFSFGANWNYFGDRQSVLAKLVLAYDDGSRQVITTNDRDWKYCSEGPLRYGSLDMGEVYDATREVAVRGWDAPGFDDRNWQKAVVVSLAGTVRQSADLSFETMKLVGQIGESAGVFKVLTAKSMREVRPGVYVYDLGQNIVGVPRIAFRHGRQGKTVTLRYAEMLYPDLPASGGNVGMIMTENLRAALCQDTYIQRDGTQVYQPRFTSHGFQYIEVTGVDEPPSLDSVQGIVISSVRSLTAGFESSNPLVNQLWSNLVWSNVDNFLTIPTDCPQRNERMGWSGDISVFSRTATYVSNADPFFHRHLLAMRDVQSPNGRFTDIAPIGGGFGGVLWGSAGITVPWETYQQYGDRALLAEHYDAMAAYIRYLSTTIDPKTGLSSDSELGDWLGPQNEQLSPAYLTTAYHILDLDIMTRVAGLLGKTEDARQFRRMHDERKAFFNKTFVNGQDKVISPKGRHGTGFRLSDTQTAYAVGLALDAFDTAHRPPMAANLARTVANQSRDDSGVLRPRCSLMTGFIGTAWIGRALSDTGRSDLAYCQLQNRAYPSWLYPIDQGATTIWERLNGYTVEDGFGGNNSMNSFNHYSFGAVGQWLMARSLGIERDEPGFHRFVLRPEPDPTGQMTWARGYYDSVSGRIASSWKVEDGALTYAATLPANTSALLYLRTSAVESVREGGRLAANAPGIRFVAYEDGKAVYRLQSGDYEFTVPQ